MECVKKAGEALGPDATAIAADVGSLDDLDHMAGEVRNKLGNVDVLFINAGVFQPAPLDEANEEHYNFLMDINLKGAFFSIRKVVPTMNDGGSIILNSSNANQLGLPGISVYAATKAALRPLSRTLGAELWKKHKGQHRKPRADRYADL